MFLPFPLSALLTASPAMQVEVTPQTRSEEIIVRGTRGSPHAGSETAVRRMVGSILRGEPDYTIMTPALADGTSVQLTRIEALLFPLGEMRSITYLRNSPLGGDEYVVTFERGSVIVDVALTSDGKVFASLIAPAPAQQ